MKKIITLITVLIVNIFANDVQSLLDAHKESLKIYQSKDRNITKKFLLCLSYSYFIFFGIKTI